MLDFDPDVFVSCGETNPDGHSRNDPVVVAEVLSPSTQRNDRGDKRLAYEHLPSLREYVLIWHDRVLPRRESLSLSVCLPLSAQRQVCSSAQESNTHG